MVFGRKKTASDLENHVYRTLMRGKATSFSDVDQDKLVALGIFKETVFSRDKKGYAHITFITNPGIAKVNTEKRISEMDLGKLYRIIGKEGYHVKVPKEGSTNYEALAGIFKLGKPLVVEKLGETFKTIAEKEFIIPVYDSDAYSRLEELC